MHDVESIFSWYEQNLDRSCLARNQSKYALGPHRMFACASDNNRHRHHPREYPSLLTTQASYSCKHIFVHDCRLT